MKHLHLFETQAQYESWKGGSDYVLPNVSYTVETNGVSYEPVHPMGLTYNMVDLGLPSGTLWADRNVGAESPEDYGLYFQWGDTVGYTLNGDKVFNSSSYWDSINGSNKNFNKYTTTKLTVLQPEDDAATINMGSDWRMPTASEIQELIDNTTVTIIDIYGNEVSTVPAYWRGIKLTSNINSNSIFIPAAGNINGSTSGDQRLFGYLWSSDLYKYAQYVYVMYFGGTNNIVSVKDMSRVIGIPIRGVCNK